MPVLVREEGGLHQDEAGGMERKGWMDMRGVKEIGWVAFADPSDLGESKEGKEGARVIPRMELERLFNLVPKVT